MDARQVMLEAGLRLPGVERGIACEGTPVQSDTLKVNGRAFLFLSPKKAYFKLSASYLGAQKAAKGSTAVVPGGGGWTSLLWDAPCPVSAAVLRGWVAESHGLMASAPAQKISAGLLAMKPKAGQPMLEGKGLAPKARAGKASNAKTASSGSHPPVKPDKAAKAT